MRQISGNTVPRAAAHIGPFIELAEIELVKQLIHDTPVLLLDDVLSELDSNRQNYLLNSIMIFRPLLHVRVWMNLLKIDFT